MAAVDIQEIKPSIYVSQEIKSQCVTYIQGLFLFRIFSFFQHSLLRLLCLLSHQICLFSPEQCLIMCVGAKICVDYGCVIHNASLPYSSFIDYILLSVVGGSFIVFVL